MAQTTGSSHRLASQTPQQLHLRCTDDEEVLSNGQVIAMDPHASVSHRRNGDDEPYHYSPACTPEDIIWLGSDAEETPEETQKKRTRYEEQAQRCAAGHLPILMSANLRGPLDRKSGWENPWRYRPRKKKEDDWWQPERLEDML